MSGSIAHWHGVLRKDIFQTLYDTWEKDRSENQEQANRQVLLDEYGRFNVWAGNIGAHQAGRVSLDFRLREAVHIKDQVVSLLTHLSEAIDDGGFLHRRPCISCNWH